MRSKTMQKTPEPGIARTLGYDCGGESSTYALLVLTPEVAAEILAMRDDFIELKKTRPGLSWLVYDNGPCRFFNDAFDHAGHDVADLIKAINDAADGGWADIDPAFVPEGGDYRTDFEHLKVSETYICFEGAGKHSDVTFETDDLSEELLRSVAGPQAEAAPPANWSWPDNPMPADVLTAAIVAASDKCPYCGSPNITADDYDGNVELTCNMICDGCEAEWTEGYFFEWAEHDEE
jgi:hypothetical protein